MSKIRNACIWGACLLAVIGILGVTTQAHNNIGKRVEDYNITLEIIQVTHLGQENGQQSGTTHADDMQMSLGVGHFQFNIYLLNPKYQPVDSANVEIVLSSSGNASPSIQLLPQGTGQYSAEWDIVDPGKWDFQVTVRTPEIDHPLIANYDDVEILSATAMDQAMQQNNSAQTKDSSGLAWPLVAIGFGAVALAVVILMITINKPEKS